MLDVCVCVLYSYLEPEHPWSPGLGAGVVSEGVAGG